jgi:DNA-binding transcriptional MerR regulator
MRTAEVARRTRYSLQQVRKLEAIGVLRPAIRSPSGYRDYDDGHVAAADAYRALAAAIGPVEARSLMQDAWRDRSAMLARLDAAHERLHREREALARARAAVAAIRRDPVGDARPADSMTIGELADALGLRTSALRHWEAEGLLAPSRGPNGERTYTPADVRDARLVHQLRQAGYLIPALREVLPELRDDAAAAARLVERERSILARSGALFEATVALHAALELSATESASA